MRRRARARTGLAAALSALLHAVVLAVIALPLTAPIWRDYSRAPVQVEVIRPVYILPRRPSAPAARPSVAIRPSRRAAPMEATPQAPPAGPPAPTAMTPGAAVGIPAADLGAALRRRLGCSEPRRLTPAERQACSDQLGQGIHAVAELGDVLPGEKRAYYDAVMAARKSEGHGPGIGCHVRFGGGKPASVERPAHGLKLGPLPCYLVPPAGMLSPEADIPNPY